MGLVRFRKWKVGTTKTEDYKELCVFDESKSEMTDHEAEAGVGRQVIPDGWDGLKELKEFQIKGTLGIRSRFSEIEKKKQKL